MELDDKEKEILLIIYKKCGQLANPREIEVPPKTRIEHFLTMYKAPSSLNEKAIFFAAAKILVGHIFDRPNKEMVIAINNFLDYYEKLLLVNNKEKTWPQNELIKTFIVHYYCLFFPETPYEKDKTLDLELVGVEIFRFNYNTNVVVIPINDREKPMENINVKNLLKKIFK